MASEEKKVVNKYINNNSVSLGSLGFVTYVGAAIYFIGTTSGAFWAVIGALLKAAVWPAFVVYHALSLLGA
jgi:hypothetical protein